MRSLPTALLAFHVRFEDTQDISKGCTADTKQLTAPLVIVFQYVGQCVFAPVSAPPRDRERSTIVNSIGLTLYASPNVIGVQHRSRQIRHNDSRRYRHESPSALKMRLGTTATLHLARVDRLAAKKQVEKLARGGVPKGYQAYQRFLSGSFGGTTGTPKFFLGGYQRGVTELFGPRFRGYQRNLVGGVPW
jgi:hypothetical protein